MSKTLGDHLLREYESIAEKDSKRNSRNINKWKYALKWLRVARIYLNLNIPVYIDIKEKVDIKKYNHECRQVLSSSEIYNVKQHEYIKTPDYFEYIENVNNIDSKTYNDIDQNLDNTIFKNNKLTLKNVIESGTQDDQ